MYLNQILEARALAPVVPRNLTAVDTSPWMVVQYVPLLGTGGSSASIAYIVGSSMTFLVDSATPAGLDDIGVSGVILTSSSSYDTMGTLVDYINSKVAWRAYLVGALRADNSSLMLAKSATKCSGDNGLTFYGDTSASYEMSLAISGEKFINNTPNGHVTDYDDQVENSMLYGTFKVTGASAGLRLRYYSGKAGATEVQIGGTVALTTATAQLEGEESLSEPFITSKRGERLVIRVDNASVGAVSAPTINTLGKSVVFKNNRIVDDDNY